jgi:catechol 2,3-dioxygenase-like lactoylglutathione lyase family enzyme
MPVYCSGSSCGRWVSDRGGPSAAQAVVDVANANPRTNLRASLPTAEPYYSGLLNPSEERTMRTMLKVLNVFPSFSVPDVGKAKDFYGGILGFEVKDAVMGNIEIITPGGVHVTAYPKPNHEPATFTILNLIVPDVEAAVDELSGAGVRMEHYDMPDLKTNEKGIARGQGPDIAWFKDPFGNILSVIQNVPGVTEAHH